MGYLSPDKIWKRDSDNWFSQCSNIDNAERLGGALLILVGEQDHNVPPESSLRLADALMTAGKDFEMYYVPNADHGITVNGAFAQRKTREFFERTLQHKVLPMDNRRDGGSEATSLSGAATD
jgi:dipeptidyl aminopeptidase/acylaminoacyl peptidase